ncbi:cyclase family protein [Paraneptunicella aestuarii]|uniref:cyclase family protein n=1 Tax=Paraneptunicella aestuarii TaxID=2831148 RepID=UPI001E3D1FBE|nr:cyclase family protein [Paraneptunicella aestuarii]UAA39416.1 cyclase family protein [Paraneptunicella aestuarii]
MKLYIEISNTQWQVHLDKGHHISIALDFNGEQPNGWDSAPATAQTFAAGDFIADTREGGSCNVTEYRFTPHCNGTHTECVGHIVNNPITVHRALEDALLPATLISVEPESFATATDEATHLADNSDYVITQRCIAEKLAKQLAKLSNAVHFNSALVIRTLPNNSDKQQQQYSDFIPPYLSKDAMEYINSIGVRHLLVDIPSVDRMSDGGELKAHRTYWALPAQEKHISDPEQNPNLTKTITEFIYVPSQVQDGVYLLNLQIPAFVTDAAPSRPILFPVSEAN